MSHAKKHKKANKSQRINAFLSDVAKAGVVGSLSDNQTLANRRKFLSGLKDPKVRALAVREFAKLGLKI